MRQDLTKSSIVGPVIQQTFHTVNFGIHLVAISTEHGKATAGINKVGPVAQLAQFAA